MIDELRREDVSWSAAELAKSRKKNIEWMFSWFHLGWRTTFVSVPDESCHFLKDFSGLLHRPQGFWRPTHHSCSVLLLWRLFSRSGLCGVNTMELSITPASSSCQIMKFIHDDESFSVVMPSNVLGKTSYVHQDHPCCSTFYNISFANALWGRKWVNVFLFKTFTFLILFYFVVLQVCET